jgi:glyoxylase-like metal-dependent hydrolase (beta-lactamase superfamily II)
MNPSKKTAPLIHAFFDEQTNTVSYLLADPLTLEAAVIDPVLDYDSASGEVDIRSVELILAKAALSGYKITWALETHAHADHLSGSPYVKAKTGAKIGIGEHIKDVQRIFRPVFNATDLKTDGSDFDHLFSDNEIFRIGKLDVHVLHVPGHTPADIAYCVAGAAFVGDTLFMPDSGTARADFPGGSAKTLYHSIRKILALPSETRLFMCHDYKAPGRDNYAWETSVAEQNARNVHMNSTVSESAFIALREARDANLAVPKLLMPSIQVNIRAGRFPKAKSNGITYLVVPVKSRTPAAKTAISI